MKNLTKSLGVIILATVIVSGVVYAGSLTPPNTISPQSYTLSDIYKRLTTNSVSSAGNHQISTTSMPLSSMHSLTQVYDAIPTVDAAKIVAGTSYFGVTGTATTYRARGPFVNNVNTILDRSTGLLWQNPGGGTKCWDENDSGCGVGNGAIEYCQNLNLGGYSSGWRVPTVSEWLSIVDYSLIDPATSMPTTQVGFQWSSSEFLGNTDYARSINISTGMLWEFSKNNGGVFVRCVHST